MDSGDSNTMPFSSYIAASGDTLFHPLSSSSHLPSFFNPFPTTPTTPPPPPPTATTPRTSKKRSRPSRRPPTTVLATDTSNFRSMVQVFTGIPSPPLSSSFPLHSRLNFSPPILLQPFSPTLRTTDSFALTSSIPPIYQIPTSVFQSIPPFASQEFGVSRGVDGFVARAGLGEVDEDFGEEKRLESLRSACRGGMLDSWSCSSD
ncbi:extensin-like [Phalaenopsis equestris]|uniref:extensin-like n=1 Tax=Phalaenopsis equestris TaxID=78828 RepID=UPI0009E54E35|nr:extensin-like [Phalaenopsis equestris]